jgi:hypothetical protein
MVDIIKLLIVLNVAFFILSMYFNFKSIKIIFPLVPLSVPFFEYLYTGNVNMENLILYLIYILICVVNFREILRSSIRLNDIVILNNIVLVYTLIKFNNEIYYKNIALFSILLMTLSLIRGDKRNAWAILTLLLIFVLSFWIQTFEFVGESSYLFYYFLLFINIFITLIIIPEFILVEEQKNKGSLLLFGYLILILLNIEVIFPVVENLLSRSAFQENVVGKIKSVLSVGISALWLFKYFLEKKLDNKLFCVFISQLSLCFYLGIQDQYNNSVYISNLCFSIIVFYILVKKSITDNKITDPFLFTISFAGLVACPMSATFIYKLKYLSYMINFYDWTFIFAFVAVSIALFGTSTYFITELKKSYENRRLTFKNQELTLFAILIFLLPGYIL